MKNKLILSIVILLIASSAVPAFAQNILTEKDIHMPVEDIYTPTVEALSEFGQTIASWAPKILAVSILLVIGLIVGKVAGKITEKAARKILSKTSLEIGQNVSLKDTEGIDSARLVGASLRWFIYLFFIMAAVNTLEFEQLSGALTSLWLWVPNLLAFILIIVIGIIITNISTRWIEQELTRREFEGAKYIVLFAKIIIYAIVFAVAITQLGIGKSIIPILVSSFSWSIAAGIGAAVAIGLGFALKDILPAVISTSSKRKSILKVGQKVKIDDITGIITDVGIMHIILANEKNESIIIPTKNITDKTITILESQSQ